MLVAGTAAAQSYPEKPVMMVAPFPAGGSVDLVARAVAQQMSKIWKQPVVIANRPGAGSNTRSPALPEVPTIDEAGVPGYEATSWNALLAPGATPRDVVRRVHSSLIESLNAPRVRDALVGVGAEPVGNTPEEFARFLRDEMTKWGKVVKAANLRPE